MTMYKIVILGDGGVGKSCVTIQFTQNHFVREYDPTIENSYRKQVTIDDEAIMLDILDTAGQEEYSVMRDQYINSGQGFLLVYSVTAKRSFETIGEMKDKILQSKESDKFPMVLCGNKCDLEKERKVTAEEGRDLAKSWNISFFETSAKSRINIEESFIELVKLVRDFDVSGNEAASNSTPTRPKKKKKSGGGCALL
uniref:small monomeric GTPase n=1 Tax=Vannella robusta TaxID=1487602 RepID=A0A7S4IDI2_9EUKA